MNKTIQHLELMIKVLENSENSEKLLDLLDTLAIIIVDTETEYMQGGNYTREFKHKQLKIGVHYGK